MNITVSEAALRLQWMLQDDTIATSSIIDALNAASDAVSSYIPKRSTAIITGDGISTTFDLPADFYAMGRVFDADGRAVQPFQIDTLEYIGAATTQFYVLFPNGKITFAIALGTSDQYTMYYYATWAHVANDTDTLEPPGYLLTALLYYAAAYLLAPDAIAASGIRQFNTKVDSGNPEHNPVHRQVQWYIELFEREINRHRQDAYRVVT